MTRFERGAGFLRRSHPLVVAASALVVGSGLAVATGGAANAAAGCDVTYQASSWNTGFTANIVVKNSGDALSGWKLEFDYAGNQQAGQGWGGTISQSGQHVTMTNAAWNGSLATGGSTNVGFNGAYSGTNANPTSFSINGVVCNGGVTPTTAPPTTTRPPVTTTTPPVSTSVPPTTTVPPVTTTTRPPVTTTTRPPTTTPPVTTPVVTNPPQGTHLDNPFVGAKWYVNPEWSEKAAAEPGGSRVANQPTAVWLDTIGAITAAPGGTYTTSLRQHLDNALAQGATLATFVIYDLPGRDCAALASNGELGPTEIDRYKTEYVDPIAAIQADPKYASLRIVNLIEIDSLPNILTNAGGTPGSTDLCATMKANGNYSTGIAYSIGKLHAAGVNNYEYIDAAHHGWLGWDTNFAPAAQMFADTAKKAVGGQAAVDGFITNTANYSALKEPFFTASSTVGGQNVRQSKWIDWNFYVDELGFAQAFRQELIKDGFSSSIGMLIDTSRNGWGGANRPTKASTSTDVNTFINESRVDRRIHAGNWCNQSGAGLGERPQAAPAAGIDAYIWAKPPGESDGSSTLIPQGPENPNGKGLDGMCDPAYQGNGRNGNSASGALPDAPASGAWFSAQFQQLMANAYPAL